MVILWVKGEIMADINKGTERWPRKNKGGSKSGVDLDKLKKEQEDRKHNKESGKDLEKQFDEWKKKK